ncbi:histidine kinase [Streptomyces varsoviensis]|uniref:sensor histidine kinase n=1 Tax=Streptomyces varsoviensis TaxID=67373 RepID=UPI00340BA1C1
MHQERSQNWAVYGRYALVTLLTLGAVQNGASTADGQYLTLRTAAAGVCGVLLLLRPGHWLLAPAVTTAAAGVWGWPMLSLLLLALFQLAADRHVPAAVACAAVALTGNALLRPAISLWRPQQYGSSLFLLLAIVAGLWMGNRRRLVRALNAQVEHLRIERELREQAARVAERSAIAAEMHDVLAHRLSLIALHTGVLATRKDSLPSPVVERLLLLRTASTDALTDLRDVLGALRTPYAATTRGDPTMTGAPSPAERPAPVLRDVREVIEQARAAAQHIDTVIDGAPEEAPAAHRLAVFRLVQEALTNARKHAPDAPVRVRVDYRPPATLVEIINTAGTPTRQAVPSGFGLVGLRERVEALGGHLTAGPGGAGSWRLAARIPHPAPGPASASASASEQIGPA